MYVTAFYRSGYILDNLVNCIANIVTSSNLTAALKNIFELVSSLQASSSLSANLQLTKFAASSLNGSASLNASALVSKFAASSLTGAGTLAADLTVTGSATLLLDLYPNAAAAYSLRKLRAAYVGSAIRVRRSSDNTEQDIGFTALGVLDESALTTFCGANNGFVTTWYDQSGNVRDATQATAANQPQIVSIGVVIMDNSKPAIKYDGTNDKLVIGEINDFDYSGELSFFATLGDHTALANDFLGNRASSGGFGFIYIFRTNPNRYLISNLGVANISYSSNKLLKQITSGIRNNVNSWSLFINNNSGTLSGTFTYNTGTNSKLTIGADGASGGFMNGNGFEYIFYKSNQETNRIGIQNNINTHYAIY
jgi:hypothetical protein